MRRWRFRKDRLKEEFDSYRLATDIMVHLEVMKGITAQSTNDPEALKFYIKHQTDKIIDSIEQGDFND